MTKRLISSQPAKAAPKPVQIEAGASPQAHEAQASGYGAYGYGDAYGYGEAYGYGDAGLYGAYGYGDAYGYGSRDS